MSSTTYSRGYKIKLIGTGLEAGTWGSSTNENLKRIDQYFGGVATALDITTPTLPSEYSSNTLTWCLGDTTDAWEAGSEARNRFVVFTGTVGAPQTVNIAGSNSGEVNNDRVYWVKNNIASPHALTISGGAGANVVLQNGSTALIYTSGGAVGNILDDLQIGGLDFRVESAPKIQIKDAEAAALDITDGTNSFVKLNTDGDVVQLGFAAATIDIDAATIDTSTQATVFKVLDNNAAGLDIQSSDGDSYIKLDTENASPAVSLGKDLDLNATNLDLVTQDTDILLKTDSANALQFYETTSSGTEMLKFDTTTPKIVVPVELEITGTLDVDGVSDFSAAATFSAIDTDVISVNNATSDQALYFKKSDAQVSRIFHNSDSLYLESGGTDFTDHGVRIKLERDAGSSGTDPMAYLQTDIAGGGTTEESLTPGYDKGLKAEKLGTITKASSAQPYFTCDIAVSAASANATFGSTVHNGAGTAPTLVTVHLHMHGSGTDLGYDQGDRTPGFGWIYLSSNYYGSKLGWNDTHVYMEGGRYPDHQKTKGGTVGAAMDGGKWKWVIQCWW
tara:strand:+ start:2029 stop:3711 length:1683 start_codon:yes stop_codon:yes gene_type:complete